MYPTKIIVQKSRPEDCVCPRHTCRKVGMHAQNNTCPLHPFNAISASNRTESDTENALMENRTRGAATSSALSRVDFLSEPVRLSPQIPLDGTCHIGLLWIVRLCGRAPARKSISCNDPLCYLQRQGSISGSWESEESFRLADDKRLI